MILHWRHRITITSSLGVCSRVFFIKFFFGYILTLLFSKPNFSYFLLQTAWKKTQLRVRELSSTVFVRKASKRLKKDILISKSNTWNGLLCRQRCLAERNIFIRSILWMNHLQHVWGSKAHREHIQETRCH